MDLKSCFLFAVVAVVVSNCSEISVGGNETEPSVEDCMPKHCNNEGTCFYNESSGCIRITADTQQMSYDIDVLNTSSIVSLKIFPCEKNESGKSLSVVTIIEQDVNMTVSKNWVRDSSFKYLSQSSRIQIKINSNEHTEQCGRLSFEEVKFELHNMTEKMDSGELSSLNQKDSWYRPNTVYIYYLSPIQSQNNGSVLVTVMSLEIDASKGAYMLIGAEKEVFNGPPAAHIKDKITTPKKYFVASANAYLLFFTASSDNKFKFRIKWIRSGENITKPDEDKEDKIVPDSMLQAVPVCFYNSSWIVEFNKESAGAMDNFFKFRAKFAEIANKYVKQKNLDYIEEIRPESVQLIQISNVIQPDDDKEYFENGIIYMIIGIVRASNNKVSVFRWHVMKELLQRFDDYDEDTQHSLLGFKVGECPSNTDYRSWYYATALVAVVCAALFLTLWLCSFNTSWRSRQYRSNMKRLSKKMPRLPTLKKPATNDYFMACDNPGFIPPKISIANEQVMNISTKNEQKSSNKKYSSVFSDDNSDEEIFTKHWMLRDEPNVSDASVAYDAEAIRLRRMQMSDVPLHDVDPVQPRRLWKSMKMEDDTKESTATNQYIFDKLFDDDDIIMDITDNKIKK